MNLIQLCHMSYTRKHLPAVIAALLALAALQGCEPHAANVTPANYSYLNAAKDLSLVARATLVELENDSSYPQISREVTESLYKAIQKRQLFGLRVVAADEQLWRSLQVDAQSQWTLEQLSRMRKTLNTNAVLVGTVTSYRPYPHMAIGLRAKLIDLTDGQLLWAVEHVWDTTDRITEKRIKEYFSAQVKTGYAPLREELVSVSSLEFTRFVAHEVAETLDRRR